MVLRKPYEQRDAFLMGGKWEGGKSSREHFNHEGMHGDVRNEPRPGNGSKKCRTTASLVTCDAKYSDSPV
ncbi:hypothetical protein AVEN_53077-1, partial [Araneus ventricosus]